MTRNGGGTSLTIPRGAGGGGTNLLPFDINAFSGEAGWQATVQPGTVNQLLPDNMYDTFSIDGTSLWRCIATAYSDGESITACHLTFETNDPDPQIPTPFTLPGEVGLVVGLVRSGEAYRTIGEGSLILAGNEEYRTEREVIAEPGELTYIPYYAWTASLA